jgi:hypothetical protein
VRPEPEARAPATAAPDAHGHLRLAVRTHEQLFNSFDPSPFYEKDLDGDAEQFLVSWARELHPHAALRLTLYLKESPAEPAPERWLVQAIHHHFAERARLARAELRSLLRQGRLSLLIGIAFLVACLSLAQAIAAHATGAVPQLFEEGLTIVGWVAMWHPLHLGLYEWWPLVQKHRLLRRMSRMPVELRIAA